MEIVSLKPELIKIPSACNLLFDIHEYLCNEYKGQIHLSFGMTTQAEEQKIVEYYESQKRSQDLIIYGCTSGYPVEFQDVCLKELCRLQETFSKRVGGIGFSGHHLGIAVDIAALALGAQWFERHFTLDRTWKGTDHAASLEPDGLRKLTRDIHNVHKSLQFKSKEILDVEEVQRKKLKRVK